MHAFLKLGPHQTIAILSPILHIASGAYEMVSRSALRLGLSVEAGWISVVCRME